MLYPWHYDLTDEELAFEIRHTDVWIPELLADLCRRANMTTEWESAKTDEEREAVIYDAADELNVDIG